MKGQLSTEQVLLLNNLMYMQNNEPFQEIIAYEGKTVEQLIQEIDLNLLQDEKDYGSLITGREWKQMIQAIRSDTELMNIKIQSVHTDTDQANGGGGGVSALFTDPENNEAVVVYRGTASHEWKDDFVGGAGTDLPDGVSTQQQKNALDWYESLDLDAYDTVTVSGHSKGGNKAKYVTILNKGDTVDRCLSFDGQGFSDEFYDKYAGNIASRQNRIQNHNVESDYVNLVLNDVGDTTFYKGHDYGEGKFLENHCPNTFFAYDDNGNVYLEVGEQDSNMAAFDEFLNNYLRSMSEEDKRNTVAMIGEFVEGGFNGASPEDFLAILLDGNNTDQAAGLVAYLIRYEQEKPEFMGQIQSVLKDMGMENLNLILGVIDIVLGSSLFDAALDFLDWAIDKVPDFLLDKFIEFIKEKSGLELSREEMRQLLGMVRTINVDLDKIVIKNQGQDRTVSSVSMGKACFDVIPGHLSSLSVRLGSYEKILGDASERVSDVARRLDPVYDILKTVMEARKQSILKEKESCRQLKEAISQISQIYTKCEHSCETYNM